MNGLLDYLSPDQQQALRQQATTQGLLGIGSALLQGATGAPGQGRPRLSQLLGQAIPVGMQAYQGGMDQALREIMLGQQLQEAQRRRAQEQTALTRQTAIQNAMAIPDMTQRIDALRGLGAYEELSQMGAAEKAIRTLTRGAGEIGMENPFMVYQQSDVPGVKKLADQYAKSYETGAIDDEKATARLGELGRMEESALSRKESAAERKLTREQMAVDRQINREAQQTDRDIKRLEGTEGQKLAAGFASRMEAANEIIEQLEPVGGLPTVATEIAGSVPFIGGFVQRKAMTAEQQRYKQAADNWIRANLRKESGAVIGADEMAAEYATYFPQPGDDPATIQQKADARRITTEAMKQNAGPVYRPTRGAKRPDLKNIKSSYGLE
jgi:hypothetical protein